MDAAVLIAYSKHNRSSVYPVIAALDLYGFQRITYGVQSVEAASLQPLISRLLSKYKKLVLATSFMTTQLASGYERIRGLVELARRLGGNRVILVAGGPHASGDPWGTVASLGFDVAVMGEGERVIPLLVEELVASGGLDSFARSASRAGFGVLVKLGEDLVYSRHLRRFTDLDDSPAFPFWRGLIGHVEITRGCPWACLYCQVSYMHGGLMRHRSLDNLWLWLKALQDFQEARGRNADLRFISPDAFSYGSSRIGGQNLGALTGLAELLARAKRRYPRTRVFYGSFPSEVRPDTATREAVSLFARIINNKHIIVGAQSGSDRLLRKIRRGHTVEDVLLAVDNITSFGLIADVDLLFGLPGEEPEDSKKTLELTKKLAERYGGKVRLHAHVFMPLPGTPYATARPAKLAAEIKKELYRLAGRGLLYGQWEAQESLAWKIYELRKKGVILAGWPVSEPPSTLSRSH